MRAAASRLIWSLAAIAVLCAAAVAGVALFGRSDAVATREMQSEKVARIKAERSRLQGRSGAETRITLLPAFRIAALLTDALAARADRDDDRPVDRLPSGRRKAFADLDALNAALADAIARPGEGTHLAAVAAAEQARLSLERLAGIDELPIVVDFSPHFVPPRRANGDLALAPRSAGPAAPDGRLQLGPASRASEGVAPPTVPRYAPSFATPSEADPPVQIEIVGLHLFAVDGGSLPVLAIGSWRGPATTAPERLRFSVPREAFTTDAVRVSFVTGLLTLRHGGRTTVMELPFVVLPDRPGSFAFDQKVRDLVPETTTLVSPEILVRAQVGESRTVRRCFTPPEGWRFDEHNHRIVVVDRMGWLDDAPDPTLNGGTVEFAPDAEAGQICVLVSAKPVSKVARAATLGRFEATLVRERAEDRIVKSGVRALDWRETIRVPIERGTVEWKLYLRLFDEMNLEFSNAIAKPPPFLRIAIEADGRMLVLKADPEAGP